MSEQPLPSRAVPSRDDETSPNRDPLVVLVTGAGSGIGRSVARTFLQHGHRVVLCGRRPAPLTETLGDLSGGLVVPMDVADPDSVAAGFAAAGAAFGRLDVLVNNAGSFGAGGAVDEVDPADWDQVVAVNLTGAMLCAAAAVRMMKAQRPQGGRIINNGSISAHAPRPGSVAYTSTKHAVTGLTKSIELDGRAFSIRCGQIDIGNAATGMMADVGVTQGALQPDGRRLVEPTFDVAEVASAMLWMAELPLDTSVNSLVITAAGMPFVGRG